MPVFAVGGIVDINLQRSSASGPGSFLPGMTVRTSNGGEAVYCKAESAVPKGRFAGLTTNSSASALVDSGMAVEGRRIGVAINAVGSGDFAFFAVAGNWAIFTGSSGFNLDQPHFASDQAGTLTTTTASLEYVVGIQPGNVAASTTATIYISYPRIQRYFAIT